jgi:hypothetical protein
MDEEASSSRCRIPRYRITDTGECWRWWERAPACPPPPQKKSRERRDRIFLRRPFPCRSGFDGNRQIRAARVTARRRICTPDSDPASTRVMASGGARALGCVAVKSRDPVTPLTRGARSAPIQLGGGASVTRGRLVGGGWMVVEGRMLVGI